MLVVTGVFENERFIPDEPVSIPQNIKVVVTIEEKFELVTTDGKNVKKQEAADSSPFQEFLQYKGILPADFDYKKELAEYRNERYGNTG